MNPSELFDGMLSLIVRYLVRMPSACQLSIGFRDGRPVGSSGDIEDNMRVLFAGFRCPFRRINHAQDTEDEAVVTGGQIPHLQIPVHGLLARCPYSPTWPHSAHEAEAQPEATIAHCTNGGAKTATQCAKLRVPERKLQGSPSECQVERHLSVFARVARHFGRPQLCWNHRDVHVLALLVLDGNLHGPSVHPLDVIDDFDLHPLQLHVPIFTAQKHPLLADADLIRVIATFANVPQEIPMGTHGSAGLLH
mmetsp:Transcript_14552/g.41217  ORF Transcript_14552/g.41217 Transcript_14552/m.41217 type:complete len:250 (+) Transcript_14552:99-848(+)